jgi:hypothetical protein
MGNGTRIMVMTFEAEPGSVDYWDPLQADARWPRAADRHSVIRATAVDRRGSRRLTHASSTGGTYEPDHQPTMDDRGPRPLWNS